MCGIVGIFGPQASQVNLDQSVNLLIDRGPDSRSIVHPHEFLSMGATRLAMTDPLPRSNQPFEKKENWLVFNGEIYNHNELRNWLRNSHDIVFQTNSDTEVLLEVLRIYGTDGIQYLNGMFAFAYFENEKNRLILGRDKLGKKPLFYSVQGQNLFWASTTSALRQILKVKDSNVNENAILSYLAFGYTIDPSTIYEEIEALKPGYCCEVKFGNSPKIKRSLAFNSKYAASNESLELYEAINSSVHDRIEGHDCIAISLSGGIDSAIVAQLASKSERQVVAYSLRWSDADKSRYNTDFDRAEKIAKSIKIGFEGVDFWSSNGNLEDTLKDFIRFMGEPNSNPTGVSLIPLYRKISSDGFRLVLTGDGSDEIFGGYPRYESQILRNSFRFLNHKHYVSILTPGTLLGKIGLRILNPYSPAIWSNFHWNFKPENISDLLVSSAAKEGKVIAENLFYQIESMDFEQMDYESDKALNKVMERDSSIWLTNESNRKLDRISMAFSIEARSPFQDERVIEVAHQIMNENRFKSHDKQTLRKLFPSLNVAGVRDDKAGFISPVGHWLRTNPQIVSNGLDAVLNSGLFNKNEIARRRNDQFSGDFTRIRQLWSLVVLGYWFLHTWKK